MSKTHTITKRIYQQFAEQIAQQIFDRDYLSGLFTVDDNQVRHILELCMVIYRNKSGEITDLADVWWDCSTVEYDHNGEPRVKINDFDFALLYKALIQ